MKNKILEIIQEKNDQSGGHCGVLVTEILQKLGVTYESIRVDLIDLYKERKITTHPSGTYQRRTKVVFVGNVWWYV